MENRQAMMSGRSSGASEAPEAFRDHWWWRPGWRFGRRFYACHVAFADQTDFHQVAAAYQDELAGFPNLDLIPREWSHLTVQGVGFVDEFSDDEIQTVADMVRRRLSVLPQPVLTFEEPTIVDEGIFFAAEPAEPVHAVWSATGQAITDALGEGRAYKLVEHATGYQPHVSIAYSNSAWSTEPVAEAMRSVPRRTATARVSHLDLMEYHRDDQMYCWTIIDSLPIGQG